jgi:DNA-binding IclR family transcriptional regulator
MKLIDPYHLSHISTGAPALNRGLAVLSVLTQASPLSLDSVSEKLRLPKPSVYRLLSTLQRIGAVKKRSDKQYEPLWGLQSLIDVHLSFRERLHEPMVALCNKTMCTIEWYEVSARGMKLVQQEHPDSELYVQARPGFLRAWGRELDAVARLGYAFAEEAPKLVSLFEVYVSNGVYKKSLSKKEAEKRIQEAKNERSAYDVIYNLNGVRRYAVPVLMDESFLGVLALAEGYHFRRPSSSTDLLNQLNHTVNQLL